jgi:hypothetical protein
MRSDLAVQHPHGVANRLALEKNEGLTDARLDVPPPEETDGICLRGLSIETME